MPALIRYWGGSGDDTVRMYQFTGVKTVERIDGGAGINVIAGTGYADTLDFSTTELLNIASIQGGDGNDSITGSAGNDVISGDKGSDVLAGGAGDDTFRIDGTDTGYDSFQGDAGFDQVLGGIGDDMIRMYQFTGVRTVERIDGAGGTNIVAGTGYGDTLDFSSTELLNIAKIDVGDGNDTVIGSAGIDTIVGGIGSDVLAGGAGDDTFAINGSDAGYDSFQGDAGFDQVLGGAGDDTIRMYQFIGAKTVERIDGAAGTNVIAGTGYGDTLDFSNTELLNIASIQGGDGNDTITGSSRADTLVGGIGSDVLAGGAGDDSFLISGADNGYDSFQGDAGIDQVLGGTGDDTIRMYQFTGEKTVERIDGGAGTNVIAGTGYGDTLDFSSTELLNVAKIDGGDGNDSLTGSAGTDTLVGGLGSDVLAGGAGDDTFAISGTDTGYDSFQGDAGFDQVLGGSGDDTIRMYQFSGVKTVERIDGAGGTNVIAGTGYGDTLDMGGTELLNIASIQGGDGNDTITGSVGNDLILGGTGSDTLKSGAGSNFLFGDDGNDALSDQGGSGLLSGGAGADTLNGNGAAEFLIGGTGNDTINAGAGADVMAFNAGDGQDTLTADATQDNTLSLGGGISYANLKLSKTGNDLVLETGGTDQITLKNWYAATPSRSVLNLQVIAEAIAGFDASSSDLLLNKKIQNFDFQSLVNAYDTARVANATLAHWSAMNTLLDAHLSGSDDAALGGDLAYQYGRNGSLANIGVDGGRTVLTSNQFGVAPQLLQTQQVLQQGVARLG
jgi:Ca2+-binding RTX toxin-like protein